MTRRLKHLCYTLISVIVAALVLSYLLSQVDLREVWDLIRNADRGAVAMFAALSIAGSLFRTWRYAILLAVNGYTPPRLHLFLTVLVRNFCSDLLPARLGSLAYVAIATSRLGVRADAAFASWAHALLFDLLSVAPLLLGAALISGSTLSIPPWILASGAVFLGALFFLVLRALPWLLQVSGKIIERIAQAVPALFSGPVMKLRLLTERISEDVRATRAAGVYGRIFLLSICIRFAKYASLYLFLYALLHPIGYTLESLSPFTVILGILAAEFSASLPISGIAGIGAYQGTWVAVFQLLGFPQEIATMTSLSHHLFTQAYGYGLGILAALILAIPFMRREIESSRSAWKRSSPLSFWLHLTGAISASVVGTLGLGALAAEAPGAQTEHRELPYTTEEISARTRMAETFDGSLVFDSNRSGSFGIYRLDSLTGPTQVVFDTERQEMYPDPSPDGTQIVFASALSTRRTSPSDIWIVHRDGSNPRLILKNGTFPTFSTDGKRIYFERGRKSLWAHDLTSGAESRLFPLTEAAWKKRSVVKPRLSPSGHEAVFTSELPSGWGAWRVDLASQTPRLIAPGCEPAYFQNEASLLWIKMEGARDGSGIYRHTFHPESQQALVDDDSPRGHEYFASTGCHDRYLVYSAASSGQHSHIEADYQLFIQDRESGLRSRITSDGYTNRWPKILSCKATTGETLPFTP